jgi:hypothetical protein
MIPTINAEVMLLSWSESSQGGARIVLQLADVDDLEPFKALTLAKGKGKSQVAGQRLMAAFAHINEQEQAEPVKGGELSKLAGKWCERLDFQSWAAEQWPAYYEETDALDEVSNRIAQVVRRLCGVRSRRELDHRQPSATVFNELIRKPFMAHIGVIA